MASSRRTGGSLCQASYTAEGAKGLLKDGGTRRREEVEKMTKDLGGKLEKFYYAYDQDDVYVIVGLPDQARAAAASLFVNASGAAKLKTTVLMTRGDGRRRKKEREVPGAGGKSK